MIFFPKHNEGFSSSVNLINIARIVLHSCCTRVALENHFELPNWSLKVVLHRPFLILRPMQNLVYHISNLSCHYHHHLEKHVAQKRLWSRSKHSEQGHFLQGMSANSEIATRSITIIIIAICRLQDCQPVTDPTLAGEDADDAIWTIPGFRNTLSHNLQLNKWNQLQTQ